MITNILTKKCMNIVILNNRKIKIHTLRITSISSSNYNNHEYAQYNDNSYQNFHYTITNEPIPMSTTCNPQFKCWTFKTISIETWTFYKFPSRDS